MKGCYRKWKGNERDVIGEKERKGHYGRRKGTKGVLWKAKRNERGVIEGEKERKGIIEGEKEWMGHYRKWKGIKNYGKKEKLISIVILV